MHLLCEIAAAIAADDTSQLLQNMLETHLTSYDEDGNQPLHLAAITGQMRSLNLILGYPSCNVNAFNAQGRTALHLSAFRGNAKVVDRLLQVKGIEVNRATERTSCTATYFASYNGSNDIVKRLLTAGGDPNALTKTRSTPLIVSALAGHKSVVTSLLDAGANPNLQNDSGLTAMHAAASRGFADIVDYLPSRGADSTLKDKSGRTPAQIIAQLRSKPIIFIPSMTTMVPSWNTSKNEPINKHYHYHPLADCPSVVNSLPTGYSRRNGNSNYVATSSRYAVKDGDAADRSHRLTIAVTTDDDHRYDNNMIHNHPSRGIISSTTSHPLGVEESDDVSSLDTRIECSTNSGSRSGGTLSEKSQRTPPDVSHNDHRRVDLSKNDLTTAGGVLPVASNEIGTSRSSPLLLQQHDSPMSGVLSS